MERKSRDLVCHVVAPGVQSDLRVREPTAPAWAQAAGLSWRAPDGIVTAARDQARDGSALRLVLRDRTGDAKTIEWNPRTARVVLRRNELWSKPLYYALGDGELVVSDSLRLVLRSLPHPPRLDAAGLDTYLSLEFYPAPLTPFCEIRKVGVEETCAIDLSTGQVDQIPCPMPERVPAEFDQAVETVRAALAEAIARRVEQCPGELTLFCSGGLDSTIMAHHMRGRGRAIVLSYVGSWKNETERARRTARHAHLPLQEIQLPPFDAERLHGYAGLLDEPLGGTCGYATGHLCAALPPDSWIIAGHGSGALTLMNAHHKRLGKAVSSGPPEGILERFCELSTYMDADSRQALLGFHREPGASDPVVQMVERERPIQHDLMQTLHAVVRRQLVVAEEMTQIWPICEAFGHTPVMPYFEPRVRAALDRLPEFVLRNERYERILLQEVARRYCPGYAPPPRQLGYGLPLGLPGYPDPHNMASIVAAFSKGPFRAQGLRQLLDDCTGAADAALFNRLRRLWTAILMHAWLERTMEAFSPFEGRRVV